jgi:hypothetical protein
LRSGGREADRGAAAAAFPWRERLADQSTVRGGTRSRARQVEPRKRPSSETPFERWKRFTARRVWRPK